MNDIIEITQTRIFWTNTSVVKPSREYLKQILFFNRGTQNFILSTTTFGEAIVTSTESNIGLFKFRSQYYIVEKIITNNNNTFTYHVSLDKWLNYTLPFLERQTTLFPIRSHLDYLYNPIFEDKLMDQVPKIYEDYKNIYPDIEKPSNNIINPYLYMKDKDGEARPNNWTLERDFEITLSEKRYDVGQIYFVFDSKFTTLNFKPVNINTDNISSGGVGMSNPDLNDPFIIIPVFTFGTFLEGGLRKNLSNSFAFLTKLSQSATDGQFKGIFRGVPFKYVSERKIKSSVDPVSDIYTSTGFLTKSGNNEEFSTIYQYGGYEEFARIDLPNSPELNKPVISKYTNIQLGDGIWRDKDYFYNKPDSLSIRFNGGGFYGFSDKISSPDFSNATIDFGSYLISSTNSYANYIESNKSRINAGLRNSESSALNSLLGSGVVAASGNPTGGIMGAIGIGTSITNAHRSVAATKKDLKRTQTHKVNTGDINDAVNSQLFSNYNSVIDPQYVNGSYVYKQQNMSNNTLAVMNKMIDLFGWPSQGESTFELLIGVKNYAYFELDMELTISEIVNTGIIFGNTPIEQEFIIEQLSYGIRVRNE